jgi:hypothetical protein
MTPARRSPSLMWAAALLTSSAVSGLVFAGQPEGRPQPTSEELMRSIEERDALILDLRRRVEALERQGAATVGGAPSNRQPVAPERAPPSSAAAAHEQKGSTPAEQASAPASGATPPAPGQFEVDKDAAERALERALVVTGALLLPAGQAEIQPSFSYIRSEQNAPTVLSTQGGDLIASRRVRRDALNAALSLRFGLPFDSQLEVGIPYLYVKQEEVTNVGFDLLAQTQSHGSGFGDVNIGFAKALLHERRWWPDLIGRLTWDTNSGQGSDGVNHDKAPRPAGIHW